MINQNRIYPVLGVIAVLPVLAIISHAQSSSDVVERSGLHADLKIEQLISGNLTELNGKYKLRVAAVTYVSPPLPTSRRRYLRAGRIRWQPSSCRTWTSLCLRGHINLRPARRHKSFRAGRLLL